MNAYLIFLLSIAGIFMWAPVFAIFVFGIEAIWLLPVFLCMFALAAYLERPDRP